MLLLLPVLLFTLLLLLLLALLLLLQTLLLAALLPLPLPLLLPLLPHALLLRHVRCVVPLVVSARVLASGRPASPVALQPPAPAPARAHEGVAWRKHVPVVCIPTREHI